MSKIKINTDSLKSRREWVRHKVKDGHNIYRVLPPFGEASNGYPYRKWQIIWGLKNPENGRVMPYASSLMAEKKCPVTEYVAKLKVRAEDLKNKMQAAGVDEEEMKERLSNLNKLISDLSPKTVYAYNAIDKSGNVGLLELKSTAHKELKKEMLEYIQTYEQDPTSLTSDDNDSGVWFDFFRSGLGRDTEYSVKKCQQKFKDEKGKISFQDDRSALPDSVVNGYDNMAYDLTAIYRTHSYDDLAQTLEANMPDILAAVPDADVNSPLELQHARKVIGMSPVGPVVEMPKAKPVAAKPAKPMPKFDDGDDDGEPPFEVSPPKSSSVKSSRTVAADDDFLAQAEALLNG